MTFDSVPKIIACGCFRSGTTILAKMLSAHPEILFTSEMYSFKPDWQKHFLKKVNRLHTAEPVDVDKLDSIYSSSFVSKEDMSKFLSLAIDLDNVEKILLKSDLIVVSGGSHTPGKYLTAKPGDT